MLSYWCLNVVLMSHRCSFKWPYSHTSEIYAMVDGSVLTALAFLKLYIERVCRLPVLKVIMTPRLNNVINLP